MLEYLLISYVQSMELNFQSNATLSTAKKLAHALILTCVFFLKNSYQTFLIQKTVHKVYLILVLIAHAHSIFDHKHSLSTRYQLIFLMLHKQLLVSWLLVTLTWPLQSLKLIHQHPNHTDAEKSLSPSNKRNKLNTVDVFVFSRLIKSYIQK